MSSLCDLTAILGLPGPCSDIYAALLAIVRNSLIAGNGIVLTRAGDKVVISLIDPLILAGPGIIVTQNPDGTYTISSSVTSPVLADSDTIDVQGSGTLIDPYTFNLAPGALLAGPGIALVQGPNGVYTISSTATTLQFWTEQYDPARDLTSWNAVNNSIAGFRNITGFTINRRILNNLDPFGVDAVDLHQSTVFGATASGANSGIFAGVNNRVSAARGAVVTGSSNNVTASATDSGILSGANNVVFGVNSVVGGGQGNNVQSALTTNGGIFAGSSNLLSGTGNAIVAGTINTCPGTSNVIGAGNQNATEAGWTNSAIVSGLQNGSLLVGSTVSQGFIGAGVLNRLGTSSNSAVVAGQGNSVSASNSGVFVGSSSTIGSTGSGNNAIVAGSSNSITTTGGSSVVVAGDMNSIAAGATRSAVLSGLNNSVAGAAANSAVLSGNGVTIVASDTHNFASSSDEEEYQPPTRTYASNSAAGGSQVTLQGSDSFAMGHSLLVSGAHSSMTVGSYLYNKNSHSVLLGHYGRSSSVLEHGALEVCSGSLNDDRTVFLAGRDREGNGVVCSDGLRMSGTTTSYFFPKDPSSPEYFITGDDVGYFVSLSPDGSVVPATESSDVLGVTVPRMGVMLNSQDTHWHGKYLKDDFGRFVTRLSYTEGFLDLLRHVELSVSLRNAILNDIVSHDEENVLDYVLERYGEQCPSLQGLKGTRVEGRQVPVINPSYDSSRVYLSRAERGTEWVPVVQKGVVRVRCTGECPVGSYCNVNKGVASVGYYRGQWKIIGRVSSDVITIVL